MQLYHRTTSARADSIMANGFRDGTGHYMTDTEHSGVWVSNVPLDENEGAGGDTVLCVTIDEALIAEFEWIQDIGYREWLIPAVFLNQRAAVRVLTEQEVDDVSLDVRMRRLGGGVNPPDET